MRVSGLLGPNSTVNRPVPLQEWFFAVTAVAAVFLAGHPSAGHGDRGVKIEMEWRLLAVAIARRAVGCSHGLACSPKPTMVPSGNLMRLIQAVISNDLNKQ